MKRILYILFTFLLLVYFTSCKEEPVGQTPTDSTAPGCIKNPIVENLPGGAIIKYDLPDDDDLLCVKAVYTLNGQVKKTMASLYNDTLKVEGFGSTYKQTILLYTVDRSLNESTSVEVIIHPQTPPVETVFQSLALNRDFGGVQVSWENTNKADIAIYLLAADSLGELAIGDIVYTNKDKGKYSLRGFSDKERTFAAFVRDRWDNISDTIQGTFIPYFEMKLDKSKWKREKLNGDNTSEYDETWTFNRMFDDNVNYHNMWCTGDGNNGELPVRFTIDLGSTVKLSRYKLWHRTEYEYAHFNPKRWKVYGCLSPRFDLANDDAYWKEGGYKKDWILLGNFVSEKPSGEGPITQEDRDFAKAGFEFSFSLDIPPIRYLRFEIDETWAGSTDMHIAEITCWGKEE